MQFNEEVKTSQAGLRLDQYLAQESGLSRSTLQKLLDTKRVKVNGKPTKKSHKLVAGDQVSSPLPKVESTTIKGSGVALEILYEDAKMLVINKPAGIVVHPDSTGHRDDTIVNAVLSHLKIKSSTDLRPGIVHRLDKDTSGALVVAKTPASLKHLSGLFAKREVHKTYLALVKGTPHSEKGRIEASIKRDSTRRKQMAINSQGRSAITTFEVVQSWGWASLLKVKIETGRTHQIRLHLASIGHPVIGDQVYGDITLNNHVRQKYDLKRQFLHAWHLEIDDRTFTAPLPPDLLAALPSPVDL